ncbi:MAG: hypothetical protein ACI9LM_003452 [Alteromonadaceae bacterium]|jgi:hypothetical protein
MIVFSKRLLGIALFISMSAGATETASSLAAIPLVDEAKRQVAIDNYPVLSRAVVRPWYQKINYFILLGQEKRDITVSRQPLNLAIDHDGLNADYNSSLLSFTAGGNLFNKTSLHLALTLNRFNLKGNIQTSFNDGINTVEPVEYQRNKTLTELFVEHELSRGISVGFDAYYSGDAYRNAGQEGSFLDEEFGAGLLLSRQFTFKSSQYRLDYILSHRQVKPGVSGQETLKRTFHNAMLTYSYQWNYDFSMDFNARLSYYPQFDPLSYWDNDVVYALGAALIYRLWDSNELVFKAERMSLGGSDHLNILSLTFEHHFGANKSKRRKRRHKIPQLLIK